MKFSRVLQFALGLASLFPAGLPLSGQLLRVGTSDEIPIGKLETMNDALQIADRGPIFNLLKRLGIDANVAEAATSPRFSHDIEIQSLRTFRRFVRHRFPALWVAGSGFYLSPR